MTVTFYDIKIDERREVTQADIDMMTATVQAYGKLRAFVAQTQAELMAEVERVRVRGNLAAMAVGIETVAEPAKLQHMDDGEMAARVPRQRPDAGTSELAAGPDEGAAYHAEHV